MNWGASALALSPGVHQDWVENSPRPEPPHTCNAGTYRTAACHTVSLTIRALYLSRHTYTSAAIFTTVEMVFMEPAAPSSISPNSTGWRERAGQSSGSALLSQDSLRFQPGKTEGKNRGCFCPHHRSGQERLLLHQRRFPSIFTLCFPCLMNFEFGLLICQQYLCLGATTAF